ncbi:MAG: DUF2141 domain-containing protein [Sphingomonadaceae bacterium]|jgi:uncharacterized protein (DUF2141 family)|nr:DUF2141 domain-containing protein [Sphingomonadaceae bacterium]
MGSTSVFGIGCAALILGSAIFPISAQAANELQRATVEVDISKVRNAKGKVLVCLTSNAKAYPDCGKDPASRKLALPASATLTARFEDVPPGTYAIALIHDENSNNRMDLALFLPKEGFGMSQNPKIGMGPPKFKNAQFVVNSGNIRLPVMMRYML